MMSSPSQGHNAGDRFQWSDPVFHALLEDAIDALVIVDRQGHCLDGNESACLLIGIAQQQFVRRDLPTWLKRVASQVASEDNVSAGEKSQVKGEADRPTSVEMRLPQPDGSERQISISSQWVVSEQVHLVVLRDVTRQRQADAQLQAIAQSLQLTSERSPVLEPGLRPRPTHRSEHLDQDVFWTPFEQADLGLLLCSAEGVILRANSRSCEIFACSEAKLVRHHLKELMAPEELAVSLQYLKEMVMGDRTSFMLETRYVRKDGTSLWYSLSVVVLGHTLAEARPMMAMVKDIGDRKQLETALKDSEALVDSVLNSAAACITRFRCFSDRSVVYEYCSDGAEIVFGYSAQEILSDATLWRSRVEPEDYHSFILAAFESIFKEQEFKAEYRFRAKDGSPRWISTTLSSQLDLDRQCWYVTAVDVEISERKKAEIKIEESHRRYRDLVNSTEGIVWEANAKTLQFTFVSQQAEQLLGYPVEQWLTEHNFWANHIHPEDRQRAIEYCLSEIQQCRDHDFEYRSIAADGRAVWLRDLISVQSEGGVPTFLRGLMVDITSRKEAEGILARYERIVSATPDGVALLGLDYTYQIVNQAYLDWHYETQDNVVGHPIVELLGRDTFEQIAKPYLDRAIAGEVVRYQDWLEFDALGRQYVEMTYAPYTESEGQISGVVVLTRNLTDLKQAEIAIQQLAESELLLMSITNHIRQSLDLDTILSTTAAEVRKMLRVDRVLVYHFDRKRGGEVIAESVEPGCISVLGYVIRDPCLTNEACLLPYKKGKIQNIADIYDAHLTDCYIEMLSRFQVRANLVLPIVHDNQLWGLLIAQHCTQARVWEHEEIDVLKQLTNQLAIAIQQSELYEQVQHLNDNLELEVEERTAELRQALEFEALLKRITDKVRDGLDESQILQTVVEELADGLNVECCDTGIYNADRTTSTVTHEVVRSLQPSQGKTFELKTSCHPEIYPLLFNGQSCQFSDIVPSTLRSQRHRLTILACPIVDDQQTIGDLWLFKPSSRYFDEAEVRLVQQVANQCAIALRQARLYQSAQTQVVELERLNQLKDDFLSTVSHELRTPMATIKMATQMVEMQLEQQGILGQDDTSLLDRYVKILRDECQRETDLINNLLDLTRLDSDTEPLLLTVVNLQTWVAHITEPWLPRLESQQQILSIEVPAEIDIEVDLEYLERILSELLENACKYTPAGHHIAVVAQSRPGLTQLTVSNSGVDIPQVECDRMFDKFYRIPNHDPWKHGGTGLGLALVKKLADKLNATIRAESCSHQLHLILEFYVPESIPQV
mgnify:CR=1 FL=1